jgi:rhodanese-related sulfurtransferase
VAQKLKTISASDAHELLRKDPAAVLVCAYDTQEEFKKHDLEGAISLSDFRRRMDSFPKDETIIFYCACPKDATSTKQAEECMTHGFVNTMVLEGGVNAWTKAGYALVGSGSSCK